MYEQLIIIGSVGLATAIIGALIALKIQRRSLKSIQIQHKAWENAQENHQRWWEVQQEKRSVGLETKVTTQVEHIQEEWESWKANDAVRVETFTQLHEATATQLKLE